MHLKSGFLKVIAITSVFSVMACSGSSNNFIDHLFPPKEPASPVIPWDQYRQARGASASALQMQATTESYNRQQANLIGGSGLMEVYASERLKPQTPAPTNIVTPAPAPVAPPPPAKKTEAPKPAPAAPQAATAQPRELPARAREPQQLIPTPATLSTTHAAKKQQSGDVLKNVNHEMDGRDIATIYMPAHGISLPPEDLEIVRQIASVHKRSGGNVHVVGYAGLTASDGSRRTSNDAASISLMQASAVARALHQAGIPKEVLKVDGKADTSRTEIAGSSPIPFNEVRIRFTQ